MASLINHERPPVFCPGCSHDRVLHALDAAFEEMNLEGNRIAMVSDIGCSGLFDTFFNTHALHGLHGRALTYAAGLKLAQPEMNVVVTMGDGGLGIGGAHLLAACRRNLDMTLLVLNNFNFGMTGGQFSATTPADARVASGFLNQVEKPLDACSVVSAAGAGFVVRASAYQKGLTAVIRQAIEYPGFAVVEIQGVCPGRYTRQNKLNPKMIEESMAALPVFDGPVDRNQRPEYGRLYRNQAASLKKITDPAGVEARFTPPEPGRREVVLMGSAGQRIVTAGELLGLAGLSAGLYVTQKNEYNITVLRGPSISDLILSPTAIDYAGMTTPSVILALAEEGVTRRAKLFGSLGPETLVIRAAGLALPETRAQVQDVNFKAQGLKSVDWALAALAVMSRLNRVISPEMLDGALAARFKGDVLASSRSLVAGVTI